MHYQGSTNIRESPDYKYEVDSDSGKYNYKSETKKITETLLFNYTQHEN